MDSGGEVRGQRQSREASSVANPCPAAAGPSTRRLGLVLL